MAVTRKQAGILLVAGGLAIAIPLGIEDIFVNLPLGIAINDHTGIPLQYALPLTYLLGVPLIAIGLLLLTRRQRNGVLGDLRRKLDDW